ncbi:MAG TPA: potassium channel family protein [Thermoanaerobaculia bacterium]|nr:potassium channel family protein [Thermoanaerobaculia bacterium]HQR67006.1 potassium channel family protein [Thermoanaerobaculia bacterium]
MKIPKSVPTRYSTREFLALLIAVFVAAPFLDQTGEGGILWSVALTVVLVSSGFAVGDSRLTRIWVLLGTAPAVLAIWLHHLFPAAVPMSIAHVLFWVFAVWVSFRLLRFVLRAKQVDGEVLAAAAATYLLAALAWGAAYIVVFDLDPKAFAFASGPSAGQPVKGFTALYFSLSTLSTVAYGDIMPTAPAARLLSMAEAVTGIFYMTIVVARLVSTYSGQNSGKEP